MTLSRRHRAELKRKRRGSSPADDLPSPWTSPREKVEAEGECRACQATGELHAAHVIPRSLGGGYKAESVIPLCPGCHADQHAGVFELAPLLHRSEEVEAVRVAGLAAAYRYLTRASNSPSGEERGVA